MENMAWVWMAIGLVLVVVELFVPSFFALFFGVAALIVGALVFFIPAMSIAVQGIIFTVISIITIAVFFKCIKPKLKSKHTISFDNKVGIVVKVNTDSKTGVILFPTPVENKEKWNVRSETDLILDENYRAVAFDEKTNSLKVEKLT